jgi:thioesterase domain-containing protein
LRPQGGGEAGSGELAVLSKEGNATGRQLLEEAEEIVRETDDSVMLGNIHSVYGRIAQDEGRYDRALEHLVNAIDFAGPLFRALAHRLGSDQPFLGLPLPDLNVLPTPYRMEDIASHCIQTMQDVQPEGLYFVGGWSDAGVMAYEIAQQLQERGETVALVVLFDTENQSYRPNVSSSFESALVRWCFFTQW